MTGCLAHRSLMVAFLVLTAVLGFYVLCLSLDTKWSHQDQNTIYSHKRPPDSRGGSSNTSEEDLLTLKFLMIHTDEFEPRIKKLESQKDADPEINSKRLIKPAKTVTVPNRTSRTNTTSRTSAPKAAVKPTVPDFIGDRYASDPVLIQTAVQRSESELTLTLTGQKEKTKRGTRTRTHPPPVNNIRTQQTPADTHRTAEKQVPPVRICN